MGIDGLRRCCVGKAARGLAPRPAIAPARRDCTFRRRGGRQAGGASGRIYSGRASATATTQETLPAKPAPVRGIAAPASFPNLL